MPAQIAAVSWDTVPAVVNVIALVVFAGALCWRLDQIRRSGGGLQALAMTVSISALTLAFVVSNDSVTLTLDSVFAGVARLAYYALLAVGVAALIVVFFFPGSAVTRERRAGVEAVPLVVALIGLQVSLAFIPSDMRDASVSHWTVTNWGFALFYLIASGYLAYGFVACVRSVRKYLLLSDGYLKTSLILLSAGLGLLAIGSVAQIFYVLGNATGLFDAPGLLTASRVLAVLGVVGFLMGITYPMVRSRLASLTSGRRRKRDAERILPLWSLVTDAVPEVVLPTTGPMSPTALLHRRVIEIRDALTQLSPFLPVAFGYANPEVQAGMLRFAVARRKDEGSISGEVRPVLPAGEGGLEGDAEPLIRLSEALSVPPPDYDDDDDADDLDTQVLDAEDTEVLGAVDETAELDAADPAQGSDSPTERLAESGGAHRRDNADSTGSSASGH